MNFGHLAVFDAVARTLSVSRAGEMLMVSQPAVSKQLAQLERSLKTLLVDRLPRGVRLTAAGELLASYARRIFSMAEEAQLAIGELAGLSRGRLVVAATTTIGVYWLPSILAKFRRLHPNIELRMEVQPSTTIARLLLEGAIDLGLVESAVADDRIEAKVFMRDRMIAITGRNGPLSHKRQVSPTELCRAPFVVREVGSGTKSLVEKALTERGLKITPAMSLGSTEAIKRAVMEGVGVAMVSKLAVGLELAAGKLIEVKVRGFAVERDLYLLRSRGKSASAAVGAFIKLLAEPLHKAGR
jgi:DNA-binding transcriptional LysR family regulator